jgi:aspartate--ammonia ligase
LTTLFSHAKLGDNNTAKALWIYSAAPFVFHRERMTIMKKYAVPAGYKAALSPYETQTAIGLLKRNFEDNLYRALNLTRVSAPLFVDGSTGLNDNLNGVERPVEFHISATDSSAQIVHSLAKWKRYALQQYGFPVGEGLYTDMNAIRRDEEMDALHSIYVDQWDWEVVIERKDRTEAFLKETAQKIVNAICDTKELINKKFPNLKTTLSREVSFVTTQELEDLYPGLEPKAREEEYLKDHKTAFIMKIGDLLNSGVKHDGRAPDYDDWQLNGDIVFWNETLKCAFEVSSMGIRVDERSLDLQLEKADCIDRRKLPFHKMLLEGKLPLTMGGGIGQSRISMLLLEKAHIGEVQGSVWDEETKTSCAEAGVGLL